MPTLEAEMFAAETAAAERLVQDDLSRCGDLRTARYIRLNYTMIWRVEVVIFFTFFSRAEVIFHNKAYK